MPNGYVSQIQINGGDVQNIGSCAYAVCDTAEDVSVKVVTLPGFVLKDGATIHIKFMYRNIAFNPKLNVNGTGGKTILLNTNSGFDSSLNLSSQYNVDQLWMAGAVVTLTYDGTYWVVNNPSRITSPYTYNLSAGNTLEPGSYMILADIEWELCTGASSATARVFPFKVCMSTMVDGVYRDRSAIMEVFVGGGYNKKDYVDIMIHDESEYHVNNDYVFDSLVDSVFIYFEYEVSSGNVISKRTGHLLGKVPSRWSSFQLVPLTNGSVSSADPDEDHHFLKLDIAHSASSFVPSETSQTSIPSGNVLPTTVGVHRYLIKARLKPFEIGQLSGNGSTAGQYLKSNGGTSAPSWESFDTTPTANSTKPVTSGGIKTALDAKQATISVTTNTNTPADNDTVIMQASGTTNTTSFLRRTMSKIWDYIKSKADSVYLYYGFVSTPGFLRSQYRIYDWRLHDFFYALNERVDVSLTVYDATTDEAIATHNEQLDKLFDGHSETYDNTFHLTENQYAIVRISNNFTTFTGSLFLGFYYKQVPSVDPIVRMRNANNVWETLTGIKYKLNLTGDVNGNCFYVYRRNNDTQINEIEIKYQGRSDKDVYLSNIGFFKDRGATSIMSAVTKHAVDQQLYGSVTAPKFIMRGGTNKQVLLANGTTAALPLEIANGGTGATTAIGAEYNILNQVADIDVALTDTRKIALCNQTKSSTNGVFRWIALSNVWNWIKGKADAEYWSKKKWEWNISEYWSESYKNKIINPLQENSLYAADKLGAVVTWKTYNTETDAEIYDKSDYVSRLFLDTIENVNEHPITGEYDILTVDLTNFTERSSKIKAGTFIIFFRGGKPASIPELKIYRTSTSEWETLSGTNVFDYRIFSYYENYTDVTKVEIKVIGQTGGDSAVSYRGSNIGSLVFCDRRNTLRYKPIVTKYAVRQDLFGEVIAPKFTKRGGTSQQVLLANGTTINMPSTTGTNKDTLLKNLVSGLSVPSSDVTDTMEIVTSSSGTDGFGTSGQVNVPFKRRMTKVWDYIKGKADAVYATIASLANYYTKTEVDTALDGKRDLFSLTNSWIGQNLAGTTYGVACRFKLTSVSEARTIYMRINARGVIHNLKILASSSSLAIGDRQAGKDDNDDEVYGHLDTSTGIVTIYLKMRNYREGASVTEFNPAGYYYYNNRLTDVTFPNKESVDTLPEGYVTAVQDGWARYDKNGNDISTYYQPALTLPLSVTNGGTGASDTKTARLNLLSDANEAATDASDGNFFAFRYQTPSSDNGAIYYRTADKVWNWIIGKITAGTGLSKSGNTINHSNSVTAQTSNLGSSVRIPAIKYDAQGHITYGTYYDVFSSDLYSVIKCGYINNSTSGAGWMKVGEVTYWTGTNQRYTVVISVMGNYVNTYNDFGILRIRLANGGTAGVALSPSAQWLVKTAGTSTRFKTDCIRLVKTETSSSSGVTLSIYMYVASSSDSYNFQVINEAVSGSTKKSHLLKFSNSTAKETTEPSPTYSSVMAPLELGNQSNCLVITNDNWQSYLTASNGNNNNISNCDILTIPEGITSVFFSQSLIVGTTETMEANIALVRGAGSLGRFPRNGVRISIAGNWRPQENGGYSGPVEGRFSNYLYNLRSGWAGGSEAHRIYDVFEDFMYFNGVWYSKGY